MRHYAKRTEEKNFERPGKALGSTYALLTNLQLQHILQGIVLKSVQQKKDIPPLCKNTAYNQWQQVFKASAIDYFYAISNTVQNIDFKNLYEQSSAVIDSQKILIANFQVFIANNQIIVARHEETNGLQSQKINLLQLQVLELQKFIFSGKQEKFKLNANSNEQQIALFENDKLVEVVVESARHIKRMM